MLLHFALVLHFEAILITFCGVTGYRKIPKISPGGGGGAYFLRGLYSEGLMFGGKFAFQNRLG